jgi:hypothetical protein
LSGRPPGGFVIPLANMDLDNMDDSGMWLWAGLLTIVALAASLGIAVWWQRRKN